MIMHGPHNMIRNFNFNVLLRICLLPAHLLSSSGPPWSVLVIYCKNVTHRSLSQRHTTDLLHRAYYTNFATLILVTLPSTSTTYFQQQQQHARRHSSYISIRCLRLR
jgi:hypothetical protein